MESGCHDNREAQHPNNYMIKDRNEIQSLSVLILRRVQDVRALLEVKVLIASLLSVAARSA